VLFSVITVIFYAWAAFVYFYQPADAADVRKIYSAVSSQYMDNDAVFNTDPYIYGPFQFYNTNLNGKKIPDRLLLPAIPEFRGNKTIRELWRGIKVFLSGRAGAHVYAGYDANILPENEAENEAQKYSRLWLVSGGGKPFENITWIKKHFREISEKNFSGESLVLLEKISK
jgi:hypothetical protein